MHIDEFGMIKGWQDGSVVKVLAAKPDNLSLTPRTHRVEGQNQLPIVV